jgi:hypothetical protein
MPLPTTCELSFLPSPDLGARLTLLSDNRPRLPQNIPHQPAFADGSFDTSRNDTVRPSNW